MRNAKAVLPALGISSRFPDLARRDGQKRTLPKAVEQFDQYLRIASVAEGLMPGRRWAIRIRSLENLA
jgi:hypothetical protein